MDKKENVMLDLETMGNHANSAIVSIGAVAFDNDGLGGEFYLNLDLQSCLDVGLSVDGSTVMWWLNQSKEARESLTEGNIDIYHALMQFSSFIDRFTVGEKEVKMWGNGASFDNTILSNAYNKISEEKPWRFWNDMCYRTVKNLNRHIEIDRVGIHHNALDDAKSQAKHLITIMNDGNI